MIFMTSNLGAAEMSALIAPKLGIDCNFNAPGEATVAERLNDKLTRSGVEAARHKFTPEFMNRIDKCVAVNPLGGAELSRILDLQLAQVQNRILSPNGNSSRSTVSEPGKEFFSSHKERTSSTERGT